MMTTLSPRAYLQSIGMEVGARGRFSLEHKAALAAANIKAPTTPAKSRVVSIPTQRTGTTAVRKWAKDNGFAVQSQGKLSQEILEAYAKTHGTPEFHDDAAQSRHDLDSRWIGENSAGKTQTFSAAVACFDCSYSLAWCGCRIPKVIGPRNEYIAVSRVG